MRSAVAALALAGGLAALPAWADWPIFRGDAEQNGVSPAKLPGQLTVKWQVKTGEGVPGTAAVVGGVVYVGSLDKNLYAIDLASGQVKWKATLGPIKSPVGVKDGAVYVGDEDGKFHCVDAATGQKRWSFEAEGEITSGANFAGDTVLFGSHDQTLYCLGRDGKERWRFKTDGPVYGSPAVVGDRTFVAGCDSALHVLDVATGKEVANVDLGGQSGATAAVRGDQLYVGTMTNQVLAIDWKKAQTVWSFEAARHKQPFYASAAVTDELVVVGSRDKRVYALDRKTGRQAWDYTTGNRVDGSPVVANGRVYVGSLDGNLYVLDLAKGTEAQPPIKLDGPVSGSPAVVDGSVVVGTEAGTVYCFGG
jgi:outer membrane protein assembly factor BamB